jgi:hypothetical protein
MNQEYDFLSKEEMRVLFLDILQEFLDEEILEREVKSPSDMMTLTDDEIKELLKKQIEEKEIDFNTITAKEFRNLLKKISLKSYNRRNLRKDERIHKTSKFRIN